MGRGYSHSAHGSGGFRLSRFRDLENEDSDAIFAQENPDYISSLSTEENDALYSYTDSLYETLNRRLRSGFSPDPDQRKYSNLISSALSKFELKKDTVFHRYSTIDLLRRHFGSALYGKNNAEIAQLLNKASGTILTDKGFVSSSATHLYVDEIHYAIAAKKGFSKGAYIAQMSEYPNEREFLFDKGLSYKLRYAKADGPELHVYLEVM